MFTEQQRANIIKKYSDEMEVIKLRTSLIFAAVSLFEYLEPAVEFKALQLRKIIEQIMLASLITNAEEYKKQYNRLGKEWNAKFIARDLERLNSDFFPQPVENGSNYIIENKQVVLSCEQMIDAYERMGKYLHSQNPFDNSTRDYQAISDYIDDCAKKIIYTLNSHNVTLLGGDVFINVVMKTKENGRVAVAWFEKCSEEEQGNAKQILKRQISEKS